MNAFDKFLQTTQKHYGGGGGMAFLGLDIASIAQSDNKLKAILATILRIKFEGPMMALGLAQGFSVMRKSILALVHDTGSLESALKKLSQIQGLQRLFAPLTGGLDAAKRRVAELTLFSAKNNQNLGAVGEAARSLTTFTRGAYGQVSSNVLAGEFYTCDDRLFYPVSRSGSTNSYYPTNFERELFFLGITDKMWVSGQDLHIEFDLTLQLINALSALGRPTRAQYVIVIEAGQFTADAAPSPTDPLNLAAVTWGATPILKQQLILTDIQLKHHFGCKIYRSSTNTITADQLKYAAWSAADAVPAGTSFVLRARLIEFDTEDSATDATGYIYRSMTGASAVIES